MTHIPGTPHQIQQSVGHANQQSATLHGQRSLTARPPRRPTRLAQHAQETDKTPATRTIQGTEHGAAPLPHTVQASFKALAEPSQPLNTRTLHHPFGVNPNTNHQNAANMLSAGALDTGSCDLSVPHHAPIEHTTSVQGHTHAKTPNNQPIPTLSAQSPWARATERTNDPQRPDPILKTPWGELQTPYLPPTPPQRWFSTGRTHSRQTRINANPSILHQTPTNEAPVSDLLPSTTRPEIPDVLAQDCVVLHSERVAWESENPQDNAGARVANLIVLKKKSTATTILVLNAHFAAEVRVGRPFSLRKLRSRIGRLRKRYAVQLVLAGGELRGEVTLTE